MAAAAPVQELVLRYEALSLAAAQLHMHSQPSEPSSQPAAAASSLHGFPPAAVPAASQQQPSAQLAGMGRDSPSHLLASRQPEKAHEPMFGAAQPAGAAGVASPGMLAHLQVCSAAHVSVLICGSLVCFKVGSPAACKTGRCCSQLAHLQVCLHTQKTGPVLCASVGDCCVHFTGRLCQLLLHAGPFASHAVRPPSTAF